MKTKEIPPVHPGEVLDEEFLKPLELSQYRLCFEYAAGKAYNVEIVDYH